jgi:hypothetical protein
MCHFDIFKDSWFIEIEPVTREVECGDAQSSINLFKGVVAVDSHGISLTLVKADNPKVGTFLEIGVFEFGITSVHCVVMDLSACVDVLPYCSGGTCGPHVAIAFMCLAFPLLEVRVLQ